MLSGGDRLKEIARNLGMHPTAISREIRRNRSKTKPGEGKTQAPSGLSWLATGRSGPVWEALSVD